MFLGFVKTCRQREFVKKLPLTFKYTHNVYFYKGCIIFAYAVYAIHTRKNRNQTFFSTLDDQVMADNPVQ